MKWEVGMAVPATVPITSRKSNETRQWSYNKANNTQMEYILPQISVT